MDYQKEYQKWLTSGVLTDRERERQKIHEIHQENK